MKTDKPDFWCYCEVCEGEGRQLYEIHEQPYRHGIWRPCWHCLLLLARYARGRQ